MDEQRVQAYVALIEQLLTCPQGKEGEILQTQAELVDVEMLMVMEQYADRLEQQDNSNAAWLRQFSKSLKTFIQGSSIQSEQTPQDAELFLRTVLQRIADSNGDAQQVYPFLVQYQNQLNETLLEILPQFAETLFNCNFEQ
jgi:hypothetical protein